MIIGVIDTLKPTLTFYEDWLRRAVPDVEIIFLSYVRNNLVDIRRCDGVVFTGGGDIHPRYYEREDALQLVHGVDEQRDSFEFEVIQKAIENRLPTLGICRGMQVYNVALGGTMIPDLQVAGFADHRSHDDAPVDPVHQISIESGSMLHSITGMLGGEVNTHHHQGVAQCAAQLNAVAHSSDGVVEALEWKDPRSNPFLLLVQWHPERMVNFESPFSRGILERFVAEVVVMSEVHSISQS
jgi:putative glutamine amidotransferase